MEAILVYGKSFVILIVMYLTDSIFIKYEISREIRLILKFCTDTTKFVTPTASSKIEKLIL